MSKTATGRSVATMAQNRSVAGAKSAKANAASTAANTTDTAAAHGAAAKAHLEAAAVHRSSGNEHEAGIHEAKASEHKTASREAGGGKDGEGSLQLLATGKTSTEAKPGHIPVANDEAGKTHFAHPDLVHKDEIKQYASQFHAKAKAGDTEAAGHRDSALASMQKRGIEPSGKGAPELKEQMGKLSSPKEAEYGVQGNYGTSRVAQRLATKKLANPSYKPLAGGTTQAEKAMQTGAKGGAYYTTATGRKVYKKP